MIFQLQKLLAESKAEELVLLWHLIFSVMMKMKKQSKRNLQLKSKKQIVFKLKLMEFMLGHWLKDSKISMKITIKNILAKETWWLLNKNKSLAVITNAASIDLNKMIAIARYLICITPSRCLVFSPILQNFIIQDAMDVTSPLIIQYLHPISWDYRQTVPRRCFIDILQIIIIDTHRIITINKQCNNFIIHKIANNGMQTTRRRQKFDKHRQW